ncbi:MAG TPA: anthranilate synthase component I family protein [Polyangia bacterium]|nr:anthranilate synthase component I family protein [Polyangia bacterium]
MIAVPAAPLPPAEAARRAAAASGAFWLSSPAADEAGIARDFVGAQPIDVLVGAEAGDLAELERAWTAARHGWGGGGREATPSGVPIAVGWLSYELGRRLVGLPPRLCPEPLFQFHFHDAVWVREAGGAARIFARDEAAAARLAALLAREARSEPPRLGALLPVDGDASFLAGVRRILDYLHAGDTYQVNLSRRLRATATPGDPAALAAALRSRAPAPHAAFIADPGGDPTGALTILGNSPERFLALAADGTVETRPIKGTRPRGGDRAADAAAAGALLAASKDRAEHVMIVDLERNDLGRVCRAGSVEVASLARLVSLPTVHHLVSTVRGRLRDVGLAALLGATFPGGSVTGAPKRRAMQIIDELEPSPRGPYTGATGWLGAAGDLDLAIAIRTAVLRAGALEVSVGGGIVVDSTPEGELAETEVKARAFAELCGATPAPPSPR